MHLSVAVSKFRLYIHTLIPDAGTGGFGETVGEISSMVERHARDLFSLLHECDMKRADGPLKRKVALVCTSHRVDWKEEMPRGR